MALSYTQWAQAKGISVGATPAQRQTEEPLENGYTSWLKKQDAQKAQQLQTLNAQAQMPKEYQRMQQYRDSAKQNGWEDDDWYQEIKRLTEENDGKLKELNAKKKTSSGTGGSMAAGVGAWKTDTAESKQSAAALEKELLAKKQSLAEELQAASFYRSYGLMEREDYKELSTKGKAAWQSSDEYKVQQEKKAASDAYNSIPELKKAVEEAQKKLTPAYDMIGGQGRPKNADSTAQAEYDAAVAKLKAAQELAKTSAEKQTKIRDMTNPNPFGRQLIRSYMKGAEDTSDFEPDEGKWSDDELNNYYALYGNYGAERAKEYATGVNERYASGEYNAEAEKVANWATKNFATGALATAGSVITAPTSLWDYLSDLSEYAGRYINTGEKYIAPKTKLTAADAGQIMTGSIAKALNNKSGTFNEDWLILGGKGLGDAYQLGVSILNSVSSAYLLGGTGTFVNFFGQAAKGGFEDAMSRGADPDKALTFGFWSGIMEGAGEYFSADKLIKMTSASTFKGWLKNMLVQGGIEASEEFNTTLMNTLGEALILGDKSGFNLAREAALAEGASYEDATKAAWKDFYSGILYDALGGFVSGGISAGGSSAIQMQSRYNGEQQQLVGLMDARNESELGKSEDGKYGMDEKKLRNYGVKAQSGKLKNYQAQQIIEALKTGDRELIKQAAQKRLNGELGIDTAEAATLAESITKRLSGDKLTREEKSRLANSYAALQVLREMSPEELRKVKVNEENVSTAPSTDYAAGIGTAVINADVYDRNAIMQKFMEHREKNAAAVIPNKLKSTDKSEGVSYNGQKYTVGDVSAEGDKISLTLQSESGSITVPAGSVEVSEGMESLIAACAKFGKDAGQVYRLYKSGTDLFDYIAGMESVRLLALNGVNYTQAVEKNKFAQALEKVTPGLAKTFYEYAAQERETEKKARETVPDNGKQETKKKPALRKGSVSMKGSGKYGLAEVNEKSLSRQQKQQVELLSQFAESLGLDLVFFQSAKNKAGRFVGENGLFDGGDGRIYIDVNAGWTSAADGMAAMVETMGHELTHYMQKYAKDQYAEYKVFILQNLSELGVELDSAVRHEMNKGAGISYGDAIDEVVAQASVRMLQNTSVYQKLMAEHKELGERIRSWIKKWFKCMTKAFKKLPGNELANAMEKLAAEQQKRFDDGLAFAIESASTYGTETNNLTENKTDTSLYTKRATEILNSPELLKEYTQTFGEVNGSRTEQAKQIAERLRKASLMLNTPTAEAMETTQKETEPTAAEIKQESVKPIQKTAEEDNAPAGYYSYVRGLFLRGINYTAAKGIVDNANYRQAFEEMTGAKLSGTRKENVEAVRNINAEALGKWMAGKAAASERVQRQDREVPAVTQAEIDAVQRIGKKSVNNFDAHDIRATERYARKYYQEMGTKSPFFRAWFGDWRGHDKTPIMVVKKQGSTRGKQHNNDTGWEINISAKVENETNTQNARAIRAARTLLPYLDGIVQNAVLLDSWGIGKPKSINSLMMHSMYAVADNGNGPAIVKLLVEEMNNPNDEVTGKRAYELQNIEIYRQPGVIGSEKNTPIPIARTVDIKSVSDLFNIVKTLDRNFNPRPVSGYLLNSDGTPKVLYHQTGGEFTVFNTDAQTNSVNDSETPNGIFLKSSDKDIGLQGKTQMAFYGTMSKPIVFDNRESASKWYKENIPGYAATSADIEALDKLYEAKYDEQEAADDEYYEANYDDALAGKISDEEFQRKAEEGLDEILAEWKSKTNEQRRKARELLNNYFAHSEYDGMILKYDAGSHGRETDAYIFFKRGQVKSATDNVGTFDRANPDIRYQERENAPSDRELLLQEAGRQEKNAYLQEYRRKYELYSKKLAEIEKQKTRLAQLEDAGNYPPVTVSHDRPPDKGSQGATTDTETRDEIIKTKNRITVLEGQRFKYEDQLAKMERQGSIKAVADKARADWQLANPDESVKTVRKLEEMNRELRREIERIKEQSKLTGIDREATANAEDVARIAKDLIQQSESMADAEWVTEQLQELGDYIESNGHGDGLDEAELRSMAKRIAGEIISNAYTVVDDYSDMRDMLKQTLRDKRIRIDDTLIAEFGGKADFEYFRKHNMGRVVFAKDGQLLADYYNDLRGQYGESLFPDLNPGIDMINQIVDVLDTKIQPSYEMMYSEYEQREAKELLTQEIIDDMLYGDVRSAETEADRQLKAAQESAQAVINEARQKAAQEVQEAKARADRAMAEIIPAREDAANARREAANVAAMAKGALNDAEQEKKSALDLLRIEMNNRYESAKKRNSIERKVKHLSRLVTENSGKYHVPSALRKPVANLLAAIKTGSRNADTVSGREYMERMQELAAIIGNQIDDQYSGEEEEDTAPQGMESFWLDLPPDIRKALNQCYADAKRSCEVIKGTRWNVNMMDLSALTRLDDVLGALSGAISNADELLGTANGQKLSALGETTVKEMDAKAEYKDGNGIKNFIQWQNTLPYYAFKRFGSAGETIFKGLMDGWDKLSFESKEIIDFAESVYTTAEAQEAEETTHTFKLYKRLKLENSEEMPEASEISSEQATSAGYNPKDDGAKLHSGEREEVTMTEAQMMNFYALWKREQARGHILGAGIRIGGYSEKGKLGRKKQIQQVENYLVELEDATQIIGALSERQREIVDKLQNYMDTAGTSWGNEVTQRRWGINGFGEEENYWPIKTDSNNRKISNPDQMMQSLFRLLNMGFTKGIQKNANNALVIDSAFDTFANHMTDMAKYNSLGLAILDAVKWFSFTAKSDLNEDGQFTTRSVQKAVERAYGKEAQRYFTQFLVDMNGTQEGGRGENTLSKLVSNYKVASVGANLRVAMLQPTAYVRASAVLPVKYLLRRLSVTQLKANAAEAEKYSGIAQWKALGFYDTNINRSLREMIKHTDSTMDKVREKSMLAAEWGDKLTWGTIWNACKQEQAEKGVKDEALMSATAERFREVIYRTQVIDSTMTRSDLMRSKSLAVKEATSFMSEPTISYNMMLDAANQFGDARKSGLSAQEAWVKTRGVLTSTILAYTATATAAAIIESIMDAYRDDDDYQSFAQKFVEAFWGKNGNVLNGNFIPDIMLSNKLPILKDLISILQGYNSSSMTTEAMSGIVNACRIWKETIALQMGWQEDATDVTYNGRMTWWGKVYQTLKATGQLTGLPMGNAAREISSVWNNTAGAATSVKLKTYDGGAKANVKYALSDGYIDEDDAVRLLLESGEAKDTDSAWWIVKSYGGSKYGTLKQAALAGDDEAFKDELELLTEHGADEDSARGAVKSAIKEAYLNTEGESISKSDAVNLLCKYYGMNTGDAKEAVQQWTAYKETGIEYSEISEQLRKGKMSAAQAAKLWQTYGSMSSEDATVKARKVQLETLYPDWSGAGDAARSYGELGSGAGIDEYDWYQIRYNCDSMEAELTADGKAVNGSKRDKVWAYINSLPLSVTQKDALHLSYYAESTLSKTPWHK